jgi:hypothetical protein
MGAALVLSALGTSPALASGPGVTVGSVSSLAAGARSGTVHGTVINRRAKATTATVSVRVQSARKAARVGSARVRVAANSSQGYTARVQLPSSLSRGNYYLAACTANGDDALGCATSRRDIRIKGGFPVRGSAVRLPQTRRGAGAAAAEDCTPGGHTLAKPGERVYPELGNTGYASVHSDVYINYDALANRFLDGTHVDLQQRSTQCLSDFSLDFTPATASAARAPGPDRQLDHGQRPAGHVQVRAADLPG